jgi:hypothetical protein
MRIYVLVAALAFACNHANGSDDSGDGAVAADLAVGDLATNVLYCVEPDGKVVLCQRGSICNIKCMGDGGADFVVSCDAVDDSSQGHCGQVLDPGSDHAHSFCECGP